MVQVNAVRLVAHIPGALQECTITTANIKYVASLMQNPLKERFGPWWERPVTRVVFACGAGDCAWEIIHWQISIST